MAFRYEAALVPPPPRFLSHQCCGSSYLSRGTIQLGAPQRERNALAGLLYHSLVEPREVVDAPAGCTFRFLRDGTTALLNHMTRQGGSVSVLAAEAAKEDVVFSEGGHERRRRSRSPQQSWSNDDADEGPKRHSRDHDVRTDPGTTTEGPAPIDTPLPYHQEVPPPQPEILPPSLPPNGVAPSRSAALGMSPVCPPAVPVEDRGPTTTSLVQEVGPEIPRPATSTHQRLRLQPPVSSDDEGDVPQQEEATRSVQHDVPPPPPPPPQNVCASPMDACGTPAPTGVFVVPQDVRDGYTLPEGLQQKKPSSYIWCAACNLAMGPSTVVQRAHVKREDHRAAALEYAASGTRAAYRMQVGPKSYISMPSFIVPKSVVSEEERTDIELHAEVQCRRFFEAFDLVTHHCKFCNVPVPVADIKLHEGTASHLKMVQRAQ